MLDLFSNETPENRKEKLGHSTVSYIKAGSILNEGNGFMDAFNYTLNPYSGCTFGCNYCYAASFTRSVEEKDNWGYWLKVKENALQLLMRFRKKPLFDKTIYISSVTDPYQPIERDLELTRSLLKELHQYHKPRIVIQTRSQLVTRDIDLFKKFEVIQINMTVTTDSEEVRKAFEPLCPSNKVRLKAIKEINDAGIHSCITMTPLLPVVDAHAFVESLKETGVQKFVVQPFHAEKGKFVASTREDAMALVRKYEWTNDKYASVVKILKEKLPFVGEGKSGFAPI
jgi:DNA repair photolyase